MEMLYNIKGYWNTDNNEKFIREQSWSGQIKVYDDGWFEGIVVDNCSSYKKNIFICGVIYDGLVFELYKLVPSEMGKSLVFHCSYNKGGYEGNFDYAGLSGSKSLGNSRICVQKAKGSIDELKTSLDKLNDLIAESNLFDDACSIFYRSAYKQRKLLIKIILKKYLGQSYTDAEIKEINSDVLLINDSSCEKEVGKCIKFNNRK